MNSVDEVNSRFERHCTPLRESERDRKYIDTWLISIVFGLRI